MDLLGGYGSDESDASSHNSNSAANDKQRPKSSISNRDQSILPTPVSGPCPSKKQRKLLSLGAVLPPEIFDKLVMMKQQAMDDDDEVSEGEEDEEDIVTKNAIETSMSKDNGKVKRGGACQDLLHKLKEAAPAQEETTVPSTSRNNSKPTPSEKLGDALMATSFTTTKVQRGKHKKLTNIHSQTLPIIQRPNKLNTIPNHMSARQHRVSAAPTVMTCALSRLDEVSAEKCFTPQHYEMHKEDNSKPTKMSKKEMERALRAGKFESVLQDDSIKQYQQSLSEYQPGEEIDTEIDASHRIRHVAVGMYNPKLGKEYLLFALYCTFTATWYH